MAQGSFNPYYVWLGLDPAITQPNYYQLLGVGVSELDPQRIAVAADQALSRVRSCRLGDRASQWARLLDEINAAKSCLTDPVRKAEYDRRLTAGSARGSFSRPAPRPKAAAPGPTASPTGGAAIRAVPMAAPTPSQPAVTPYGGIATPVPASAVPTAAQPWSPQPAYRQVPVAIPTGGVPAGVPLARITDAVGPSRSKRRTATRAARGGHHFGLLAMAGAFTGFLALAVVVLLVVMVRKEAATSGRLATPSSTRTAPPRPPVASEQPTRQSPRTRTNPAFRPPWASRQQGAGLESDDGTESEGIPPLVLDRQAKTEVDKEPPEETDVPGNLVETPPQEQSSSAAVGMPSEETSTPEQIPGVGLAPKGENVPIPSAGRTADASPEPPQTPASTASAPPAASVPSATSEPAPSATSVPAPTPTETKDHGAAPTPEEVATLGKALRAAQAATMDQKFDRALAELEKARSLPMRPEHRAKFDRLDLLAQYARNFQSALAEAIGALQVGEEIAVGTSTMVGVVQTAGQRITVRDQGANRTYTVDKLPAGLAIAIADKWLKKDDPVSFVLKGAYLATEKDAGPDRVTRARDFFAEAGRRDASFADLGKVLDDTYELEKEPQP